MKISLHCFAATLLMAAPVLAAAKRAPVLLELFTSEGCSSCPPAEALLDDLDRNQPFQNAELIVLSEHVDYWDQLGWKDPYSSVLFSTRQREYAAHLALPDIYTPQLVVDGAWEAVGSDRGQIRRAVDKASAQTKLPITLEASRNLNSGALHISLSPSAATPAAMVYVALAKNHVTSYVAHGENAHSTLSHTSVAYQIMKLGSLQSGAHFEKQLSVDLSAAQGQTRVIAYVQDPSTGKILALTQALL